MEIQQTGSTKFLYWQLTFLVETYIYTSVDLPAYLGDSCTPATAPITHIKRVANSRLTSGVTMWLHAQNKNKNTKLNMNGHILITYLANRTSVAYSWYCWTTDKYNTQFWWWMASVYLIFAIPKEYTNTITCSCDISNIYYPVDISRAVQYHAILHSMGVIARALGLHGILATTMCSN